MRFTCWVTKAKSIHSEFVINIDFLRQELLGERASVLRYTYCLSKLGLKAFISNIFPTD
jgi:hypothetical protein